jgi:cobaltochelatase CobS
MNALDRRPLDADQFAALTPGRQVKLGAAIPDARSIAHPSQLVPRDLSALGYAGSVDQIMTADSRFPVAIPEGSRGIVSKTHPDGGVEVAFIWKTPKSGKVTAVTVCLHYSALVNHRGTPPLPGEPMPGRSTSTSITSPSTPEPSMFATLTATPTPAPTPAPAAAGSLDAMLAAIVDARVGARIEALELELASRPSGSTVHHVKVNAADPVALAKRPHARFRHVLARVSMRRPDGGRFNVFLTGDAGTGKSTIAESIAEALGLPFHSLNCSGGLTEGALVGRVTPNLSTGELVYTPGPLVQAFRDGGVFLLDEMDAADENVLLALNTLIDARRWQTPTGETIERSPDFIFLAAGNTYGTGASRIYSGRNQLDGAFLNRFLTVSVDYDLDLERSLAKCSALVDRIQTARLRLRERNLRRWLTTRDLLKADALVNQLDLTVAEALAEITEGWTAEDRAVAQLA